MKTLCILLALVAVTIAYEYKPKTTKCYQCAYSPPTTTYKEVKVPREVKYKVKVDDGYGKYKYEWKTKTEYDIKKVPETRNGGWDKCKGPFSHEEAKKYEIDVWDCPGNCYTRFDDHGNIFRGCFEGAWGVKQNKFGCHQQAGEKWCFCKGDKCNNGH